MPDTPPRHPPDATLPSRLRQQLPSLLGDGHSRLSGWLPLTAALTVSISG